MGIKPAILKRKTTKSQKLGQEYEHILEVNFTKQNISLGSILYHISFN